MEIKRDIYDTWDETSRLIPLVARLCGTDHVHIEFQFYLGQMSDVLFTLLLRDVIMTNW